MNLPSLEVSVSQTGQKSGATQGPQRLSSKIILLPVELKVGRNRSVADLSVGGMTFLVELSVGGQQDNELTADSVGEVSFVVVNFSGSQGYNLTKRTSTPDVRTSLANRG